MQIRIFMFLIADSLFVSPEYSLFHNLLPSAPPRESSVSSECSSFCQELITGNVALSNPQNFDSKSNGPELNPCVTTRGSSCLHLSLSPKL